MKPWKSIGALALALLFYAPSTEACAGCRNPSLPVARTSEGPLPAQAIRAGAMLTGTAVHVRHQAGCMNLADCDQVPLQPAYLHDQWLYPAELRLLGEYGITSRFGVELHLPVRAIRTTIRYTTLDGAPYEPLDPGVHHRNETVAGPADPWLLYRVGTLVQGFWLALRTGVSLPLGRTQEDPFELGDHGIRHQHIQLGSGTVDPVGVLEAVRSFEDLSLSFFAQGQGALYENRHGYRAPIRLYGGGAVGTKLVGDLSGSLGIEGLHETAERWGGLKRQDGNLGRSELVAAAMLSFDAGETNLNFGVRTALARHIARGDDPAGDLTSPLTVSLGVSRVFELGQQR